MVGIISTLWYVSRLALYPSVWSQVENGPRVFQNKMFSLSWILLVNHASRLYIFLAIYFSLLHLLFCWEKCAKICWCWQMWSSIFLSISCLVFLGFMQDWGYWNFLVTWIIWHRRRPSVICQSPRVLKLKNPPRTLPLPGYYLEVTDRLGFWLPSYIVFSIALASTTFCCGFIGDWAFHWTHLPST